MFLYSSIIVIAVLSLFYYYTIMPDVNLFHELCIHFPKFSLTYLVSYVETAKI